MEKYIAIIRLGEENGLKLLTEMRAISLKLQENDKSDISKKYSTFFKIKKKLEGGHGDFRRG